MIKYIKQHKIISSIIIIALIFGGYFGYKAIFSKDGLARYVLAQVEKGTLVVSISGSGEVSAENQIDIKPKVSGEVVYANVKSGQEVKAGTLLAQIDSTDAQESVRDAELALENEKLTLQKMQGMTTDEGTIRGVEEKAEEELEKTYDNAVNTLDSIFLDLEDIMTGLSNILFSYNYETSRSDFSYYANITGTYNSLAFQYESETLNKYQSAQKAYVKNFQDYRLMNSSDDNEIESLIDETYTTIKSISDTLKGATNLLRLYQNQLALHNATPKSLSVTHLNNLNSYLSKANTYISTLFSIKNTIISDKEALVNTNFDLRDQELQVSKAENALLDAKHKLSDYYVRAPFSGVIAAANVKKGDTVGSSTAVVTLITKQKIAEISLNEVDAAKAEIGQKVTLTFDAIEDLSITGEVAEVDTIGTVSQGVVSYNVKIGFDTQDDRIKPGMTVSSSIVISVAQNVLLVPNSAIKQSSNINYVQIPESTEINQAALANVSGIALTNSPKQQEVKTGTSNDEYTEIISGLNEGDIIISQTITGTSTSSSQRNNSNFGVPGGGMMIRD